MKKTITTKKQEDDEYYYSFCIVKHYEDEDSDSDGKTGFMDGLVKRVIKKTGATSLNWSGTYAGDVIFIEQLKDKPLVPKIINAVLANGNGVYMSQGSGVNFPPYAHYSERLLDLRLLNNMSYMECMGDSSHFNGKGLSLKASDWTHPDDVHEILEAIVAVRKTKISLVAPRDVLSRLADPLFNKESIMLREERNRTFGEYKPPKKAWIKKFKALQKLITLKWPDAPPEDSPHRPWSEHLHIDLTGLPPPLKRQKSPPHSMSPIAEVEEEEQLEFIIKDPPPAAKECVVCLSAVPTTMVLPCEHCVVCAACSQELASGINAKKCVLCRETITHVLY